MNAFASLADGWAALMLAAVWQLAALGFVVWVFGLVFRLRQARIRYALWCCVLFAPLVLAPGRLLLAQRGGVKIDAPKPVAPAFTALARWQFTQSPMEKASAGEAPAIAATRSNFLRGWRVRTVDWIALAWLAGCVLMTLRLLIGHKRARQMIAESCLVEEPAIRQILADLSAMPCICIRSSEQVGAPILYGLRRPVIVIPEHWLAGLSPEEMRPLLAHEVAHVQRGDFLMNLLQRLVENLFFFHPVAWLASRQIALAREEICDAVALSRGGDATSYAKSLLAAAERASGRLSGASVGVAESRFTFLKRVEAIMKGRGKRLSWKVAIGAAALMLISAAAFAVVSVGKQPPERIAGSLRYIPSGTQLSPEDAAAAFEQLGMRAEKFEYEVPFEHSTQVSIEEYKNGKFQSFLLGGGTNNVSISGVGKHTLRLFIRETGQEVGFSVRLDSGGVSTSANSAGISLKEYSAARYWGGINVNKLAENEKIPFWHFRTDRKQSDEHEYCQSESMRRNPQKCIAAHDLVIIAFVKIVRTGAQAPATMPERAKAEQARAELNRNSVEVNSLLGRLKAREQNKQLPTAESEKITFDTIDLKNTDALLLSSFFVPGIPGGVQNFIADPTRPIREEKDLQANGVNVEAPFKNLVPKGLTIVPPTDPGSRQLLVAGTPEAIAQMRELVQVFDQKATDCQLSVALYPGAPANASALKWFLPGQAKEGLSDVKAAILKDGEKAEFTGQPSFSRSVKAKNNVPTRVVLPPAGRLPQSFLSVVPRLNGDSSVTMRIELGLFQDAGEPKAAVAHAVDNPILSTIVNVKKSETCVLVLSQNGEENTLLIQASHAP